MTSICARQCVYHFWHDRKKCCVLSRLLGAPTASPRRAGRPRCATPCRGERERLAHLRTSPSPSSRGKRKSAFGMIPHHTTVPGTRGDFLFLSLPLSLLLSSTYYLSSPNSPRSPSARSSSFSPNSLFFPVAFLFPLLRSRSGSAIVTVAPDSPLFRRRRIFPRNRSAVHQFRRDVVARSLEENYRVRG